MVQGCRRLRFRRKPGEVTKRAIQKAFFHLDCSEMYGTEEAIGIAIKKANLAREKLIITNKVAQGSDDIPGPSTRV